MERGEEAKEMNINNFPFFLCLFFMKLVMMITSFAWSNSIFNTAMGSTFLDSRNITFLDYTGDVAIIQFSNGTTYNLNVPEYPECVAYLVMSEPRYLVEGPDQDELLTDNELGFAEAMNKCIGVGSSSMEAALQ
jgi:hypothetical protein